MEHTLHVGHTGGMSPPASCDRIDRGGELFYASAKKWGMGNMETDTEGAASDSTMRERVGGQKFIMQLLGVREAQGPRSRSHRFFGRHVFRNTNAYGVFWQAMARKSVADSLMELGPGWAVFHDVPVRGADDAISHLVVGPGGVFVITSWASFRQDVWVGGRTMRVGGATVFVLPSAEDLAERASNALSVGAGLKIRCEAVVVLVDPGQVTVPISPVAVKLVHSENVLVWLRDRPQILDKETVQLITAAAASPGTWSDDEIERVSPGTVLDGFSSILLDIQDRQRVRGNWKIARRVGGWILLLVAAGAAIPVMLAFMPR